MLGCSVLAMSFEYGEREDMELVIFVAPQLVGRLQQMAQPTG